MNNSDKQPQLSTRRSMITNGAALLGTCLLAGALTPAKAQTALITSTTPIDVRKFGASGKRTDNATKAFRDALEAAATRGGGVVNVPPGEYTVGTIQLKDNVTLNIEAGATLFLSQLKEDYIEGIRTMIYAENAQNIAVTGRGKLDGLAQYDYAEMRGLDVEITKEIELA
ncbi:MAG TPA: glycosyl hydrolase family 28-related protein, partial [Chitinophagaceae bacterium]|nr:glycosyl hydrolase family 28-related protein [Chitinophagaceae bacterium]